MRQLDLVGQRFARLTVIAFAGIDRGRSRWRCRCECGSKVVVLGWRLTTGRRRSCGCLRQETAAKMCRETKTIHGESDGEARTPEYVSWVSMKLRCCNTSHKSFLDYGGRGISICESWLQSYPAFLADMGRRPSPQHSLDRIDNDGNYTLSNCRWATALQQRHNQRRTAQHDDDEEE